jgi:hypothetical protein
MEDPITNKIESMVSGGTNNTIKFVFLYALVPSMCDPNKQFKTRPCALDL